MVRPPLVIVSDRHVRTRIITRCGHKHTDRFSKRPMLFPYCRVLLSLPKRFVSV
ncbi:hypothetical protein MBEHAL_0660 [Halarchaeum acidiphilum MH1-52-1]|uniref:Uncharacterized protein n=1 Tax=Halarchaeum acidiphilum MH1-52-1 TaxID=1261545 RepID=U2YSC8_9EURY|nr:hypothetical protein MBEHAL_0660 [Halarchaeum acidiphilum MH1-52-1]